MKLLIIFIVLNIVNVVVQTIKSLATVKCGKTLASTINAIAYGIYTIVLVYMNCDLLLWQKVIVVALTNLVGVYVVKLFEEKVKKDRLWKIECSVRGNHKKEMINYLTTSHISFNYIENIGQYTVFNIFSKNQQESRAIKKILKQYHVKYFVTESKVL